MSRVFASRFGRVPEWLLDSEVSDRAVRLYAKLTRYADQDSRARPGRRRLGEDLHCSMKSIDRAIDELEAVGALRVMARFDDAGDRTSNDYLLHDQPFGGGDQAVATPGQQRPAAGESEGGGDTADATGGDTADAQNESHLEREVPPSVVPPDGGHTEAGGEVIPLRSSRALAALNGALGRLRAEVEAGKKSWSLSEAAKAEWLALLSDDHNLAAAQQFLMGYVALNTGRDVRSFGRFHWSMAAQKVSRHRAMSLYAVDQAITRIDPDEEDDRGRAGRPFWAYVEAVCQRARADTAGGGGA